MQALIMFNFTKSRQQICKTVMQWDKRKKTLTELSLSFCESLPPEFLLLTHSVHCRLVVGPKIFPGGSRVVMTSLTGVELGVLLLLLLLLSSFTVLLAVLKLSKSKALAA